MKKSKLSLIIVGIFLASLSGLGGARAADVCGDAVKGQTEACDLPGRSYWCTAECTVAESSEIDSTCFQNRMKQCYAHLAVTKCEVADYGNPKKVGCDQKVDVFFDCLTEWKNKCHYPLLPQFAEIPEEVQPVPTPPAEIPHEDPPHEDPPHQEQPLPGPIVMEGSGRGCSLAAQAGTLVGLGDGIYLFGLLALFGLKRRARGENL